MIIIVHVVQEAFRKRHCERMWNKFNFRRVQIIFMKASYTCMRKTSRLLLEKLEMCFIQDVSIESLLYRRHER